MEDLEIISPDEVSTREAWVARLVSLSGDFLADSEKLEREIEAERNSQGSRALLTHLRLAGAIPERFGHDTSEEKLYSKYTDALLASSFRAIGIRSNVITARADAADVEGYAPDYSFVADAKAFRLSRTAKNQKDFKVQAMDNWKHGKPYAMLVAPSYQYPSRNSQIYLQAIARDVCLLSYSHLASLVTASEQLSPDRALQSFDRLLRVPATLQPSKAADVYWKAINTELLSDEQMRPIWKEERLALLDSIKVARAEALAALSREREHIMRLTHEEALKELVNLRKLSTREQQVSSVNDNGLLGM